MFEPFRGVLSDELLSDEPCSGVPFSGVLCKDVLCNEVPFPSGVLLRDELFSALFECTGW